MSRFDNELRDSLRRVPAPEGMTDRIIDRARGLERRRRRASAWWRWALATAAVLAVSLAPLVYVQRLREQDGQRARQQALSALRVAGESLRSVQTRVAEVEARRLEQPPR